MAEPLPHRKGVARKRVVVQARRVDRGADAHATFSGKWHAVRLAVAPRSTRAGRSTTHRSCAFQQRDAKMQPTTGCVRSGSSPLSRIPTPLALAYRVGDRHGGEEGDRVRVLRGREDLVRVGDLDELAAVHHGDAVADVADRREVVRDEEVGEVEPPLQVHEEIEDLRAHRDVERRHGLVADDERRIGGERPRDRDALPLAPRELERSPLAVVRLEPDELEQRGNAPALLLRLAPVQEQQRLGHDLLDRQQRVERVPRVLEHHLNTAAVLLRDPATRGLERAPLEYHRTAGPLREPEDSRATVDLPEPDSPTRPSDSPLLIAKLTLSTARSHRLREPEPRAR